MTMDQWSQMFSFQGLKLPDDRHSASIDTESIENSFYSVHQRSVQD